MKITNKQLVPGMLVAAAVVSGGAYLALSNNPNSVVEQVAFAYTSTTNPVESTTAPAIYTVVFPDARLQAALNDHIARNTGAARTATQPITAAKMRTATMQLFYGPNGLGSKSISNLEGIQYLTVAKSLYLNNNQITTLNQLRDLTPLTELHLHVNQISDISPLASLTNLAILNLDRNRVNNISHLSSLNKLVNLNLASNQVTDLSPLSNLLSLTILNVSNNPNLNNTNLAQLASIGTLRDLNVSSTQINNFATLRDLPNLRSLTANTLRNTDLASVATLNNLTNLSLVSNNLSNISQLNTMTNLTMLNVTTNSISDLSQISALKGKNISAVNQKVAISAPTKVIANPLKDIDGNVVPVVETADVVNVDASGNPSQNGGYLKINRTGTGTVSTTWNKVANNASFDGTLTINYNIDGTAPTFTNVPVTLTMRQGNAIDLLAGVTATDNSGVNPTITYSASPAINATNPVAGTYTITYTATDAEGNQTTATRQVEITNANTLQTAVNNLTSDFYAGYTEDTVNAVKAAAQAAQAIIANNSASQAAINNALATLNAEIAKLVISNTPIDQAVADLGNEKDYIKQDPAVVAALAAANDMANSPTRTKQSVQQAAQNLRDAIAQAKQAEAQRQTAARTAIQRADDHKTPASFTNAQNEIAEVKDPEVKATLEAELQALRTAYDTQKTAAQNLLARATDPQTTEGKLPSEQLTNAIAAAQAALGNTNAPQSLLENVIQTLTSAINNLKTDKQPVSDAIGEEQSSPEYIKQDPEVVAALAAANDVNNQANPSVADVRRTAQELLDAIDKAKQAEEARQNTAHDLLTEAEDAINDPALPVNELPVVDIDAIQDAIDQIKDPNIRDAAQQQLDEIKDAIEAKRQAIAADERAKAEQKLAEELAKKRTAEAAKQLKSPNTGVHQENSNIFAVILASLVATPAAIYALIKRK